MVIGKLIYRTLRAHSYVYDIPDIGDRVADYSIVWYLHEALVECPPALRPYILQFDPYQAPRMMGFLADNYLHALRKLVHNFFEFHTVCAL